jgi:hypothetical protein
MNARGLSIRTNPRFVAPEHRQPVPANKEIICQPDRLSKSHTEGARREPATTSFLTLKRPPAARR